MHWPFGFEETDEHLPKDENGNIKTSDVHYIETYQVYFKEIHISIKLEIK
jgi:hypothetical protein